MAAQPARSTPRSNVRWCIGISDAIMNIAVVWFLGSKDQAFDCEQTVTQTYRRSRLLTKKFTIVLRSRVLPLLIRYQLYTYILQFCYTVVQILQLKQD